MKDNVGNIISADNECISEPMNLMSDFRDALPEFPIPNVVGVRWSYRNAIAKSVQELGGEFDKGLDEWGITGVYLRLVLCHARVSKK